MDDKERERLERAEEERKYEEELRIAIERSLQEAKSPKPSTTFKLATPPSIPSSIKNKERTIIKETKTKKPEMPKRVKALYDFVPNEGGELGFVRGDVIKVIDSIYKEWWRGELRGKTGIFPVNYVEVINEPTVADITKEAEMELSVFEQAQKIDKLLEKLEKFDPSKDASEDEEIQELYQSTLPIRSKLVKLIEKYSQKKDDLLSLHHRYIQATKSYEQLMEKSIERYDESASYPQYPSKSSIVEQPTYSAPRRDTLPLPQIPVYQQSNSNEISQLPPQPQPIKSDLNITSQQIPQPTHYKLFSPTNNQDSSSLSNQISLPYQSSTQDIQTLQQNNIQAQLQLQAQQQQAQEQAQLQLQAQQQAQEQAQLQAQLQVQKQAQEQAQLQAQLQKQAQEQAQLQAQLQAQQAQLQAQQQAQQQAQLQAQQQAQLQAQLQAQQQAQQQAQKQAQEQDLTAALQQVTAAIQQVPQQASQQPPLHNTQYQLPVINTANINNLPGQQNAFDPNQQLQPQQPQESSIQLASILQQQQQQSITSPSSVNPHQHLLQQQQQLPQYLNNQTSGMLPTLQPNIQNSSAAVSPSTQAQQLPQNQYPPYSNPNPNPNPNQSSYMPTLPQQQQNYNSQQQQQQQSQPPLQLLQQHYTPIPQQSQVPPQFNQFNQGVPQAQHPQ